MKIDKDIKLLNEVQAAISITAAKIIPTIKLWAEPEISLISEEYVEVFVKGIHLPICFYIRFFLDGKWVAQTSDKKLDEGAWKKIIKEKL